jgi:hypothetical protein
MGKRKQERIDREAHEAVGGSARTGIDPMQNAYEREMAERKMKAPREAREKEKYASPTEGKDEKKSDDMLKALEAIVLNTDPTKHDTVILKPLGLTQ